MKTLNLLAISVTTILCLFGVSCSKDDKETLSSITVGSSSIELYYPLTGVYKTSIMGGDGKYTLSNNNEAAVEAKLIDGEILSLTALSIGDAVLTIKDQSNNTCLVNVHVIYHTMKLPIRKLEVKIEGENLTESEIAEIRGKALATIPVKANGGYLFVYAVEGDGDTGKVHIYPETMDQNEIEGTFKVVKKPYDGSGSYLAYELTFSGEKRTFILARYTETTKSSTILPHALMEDLTERFKPDYPKITRVYSQQVLKY